MMKNLKTGLKKLVLSKEEKMEASNRLKNSEKKALFVFFLLLQYPIFIFLITLLLSNAFPKQLI